MTTLDSFSASVSNSGQSKSTLGKGLLRRSEFKGFELDQDQMGEGGSVPKKKGDEESSRSAAMCLCARQRCPRRVRLRIHMSRGSAKSKRLACGSKAYSFTDEPRMSKLDEAVYS